MLIGFSAKNYRSFKDEFDLSLVASNYYKENADTLIDEAILGLSETKVLPITAIYGPNASGKSTVLSALRDMRSAVLQIHGMNGNPIVPHMPFLLDGESILEPTVFSIEFCTHRTDRDNSTPKLVRYEYSFSCKNNGIISEDLRAYFSRMPRKLFSRRLSESGETVIEGSSTFPIANEIKGIIGSHSLVLSFFAQAGNMKAAEEARIVVDWFKDSLAVVDRSPSAQDPMQMHSGEIIDGAKGTDFQRDFIRKIMSRADTGLASVEIQHVPLPDDILTGQAGKILSQDFIESVRNKPFKRVAFKHYGATGTMLLPTESSGTMQLFALSGHIAQALETGGVLAVDELDASLHPDLADEIASLFLNKMSNPHGAQLVFTAHNPCLMNNDRMRRDEFWIAEKSGRGESTLYPISDFSAKKGESIQSAYLQGRYAGVPVIPACFGMCSPASRGEE